MYMLSKSGIISESTQKIILGAALILKNNGVEKINKEKTFKIVANKLKEDLLTEIMDELQFIEKGKITEIINGLLKLEKKDLINEIIKEEEIKAITDISTPRTISKLMVELLEIKDNTTIADFYSGEGKIDSEILKYNNKIQIDGFEINKTSILIAKIRMYALNYKVNYIKKDIFKENIVDKKYDYVVADIPFFSIDNKEVQESVEPIFKELNIEMTNRISTTWITILKILSVLKIDGKAIITTMKGSLFNVLDREIRKRLIDLGYIEAIIDLPNKVMHYTNIDICLIVISKRSKDKNIKLINLKDCFIKKGKYNEIDIEKAKKTFKENSNVIGYKEIITNNYSLNSNTYTGKVEINNGKTLAEVTEDVFRGYQITSSEINKMLVDNDENMNYKVLEISNINDDGEIDTNLKKINSKGKNLNRYLLKDGDILISARGEKIKKCLIKVKEKEYIIANGSINVIRVNREKINPLFLKMFLDSEKGTITLNNIKSGVTIPSINVGELNKIIITCPSIEEQNKMILKYEAKLEAIELTKRKLEKMRKDLKKLTDLI